MAKETIEAISHAELKAQETEKKAADESGAIIRQAEQQVGKIIEDMTKSAKEQGIGSMQKTQRLGDEILKNALQEAEQEIARLRTQAKEKEPDVIHRILSELV